MVKERLDFLLHVTYWKWSYKNITPAPERCLRSSLLHHFRCNLFSVLLCPLLSFPLVLRRCLFTISEGISGDKRLPLLRLTLCVLYEPRYVIARTIHWVVLGKDLVLTLMFLHPRPISTVDFFTWISTSPYSSTVTLFFRTTRSDGCEKDSLFHFKKCMWIFKNCVFKIVNFLLW